mgnify:CR=1 FL=1
MNKFVAAIIMVSFMITAFSGESKSQVGGMLKDRLKKAVVKSVVSDQEKNQNDTVSKNKDSQQQTESPADPYMQAKMMGLMGKGNVKYDLAYTFASSMKMDFEVVDSAQNEPLKGTYTMYFEKDGKNFAMEVETAGSKEEPASKSLFIYDFHNMALLILSEQNGQKSGMAMAIPPDSSQAESSQVAPSRDTELPGSEVSAGDVTFKATGRTKSIIGYSCKEYLLEDTEGKVELWVTNDVIYDYSGAYGRMQGFQMMSNVNSSAAKGTVLEMHFKDSGSPAHSDFYVREINKDRSKTFNLANYSIMSFGQ